MYFREAPMSFACDWSFISFVWIYCINLTTSQIQHELVAFNCSPSSCLRFIGMVIPSFNNMLSLSGNAKNRIFFVPLCVSAFGSSAPTCVCVCVFVHFSGCFHKFLTTENIFRISFAFTINSYFGHSNAWWWRQKNK